MLFLEPHTALFQQVSEEVGWVPGEGGALEGGTAMSLGCPEWYTACGSGFWRNTCCGVRSSAGLHGLGAGGSLSLGDPDSVVPPTEEEGLRA